MLKFGARDLHSHSHLPGRVRDHRSTRGRSEPCSRSPASHALVHDHVVGDQPMKLCNDGRCASPAAARIASTVPILNPSQSGPCEGVEKRPSRFRAGGVSPTHPPFNALQLSPHPKSRRASRPPRGDGFCNRNSAAARGHKSADDHVADARRHINLCSKRSAASTLRRRTSVRPISPKRCASCRIDRPSRAAAM